MAKNCPKCGRETIAVPHEDRDVRCCEACGEVSRAAAQTPLGERLVVLIERLRQIPPAARQGSAAAIARNADAAFWAAVSAKLRSLRRQIVLPVSARAFWQMADGPLALPAAIFAVILTVFAVQAREWPSIFAIWFLWLFFTYAVFQPLRSLSAGRAQLRLRAQLSVLLEVVDAARSSLAIGAVAEALRPGFEDSGESVSLRGHVLAMLRQLGSERIGEVSVADQESIAALLPAPFEQVTGKEWRLATEVAGFLGHTHFVPALHALDAIAVDESWAPAPPNEAREAARHAAESIRRRLDELHERSFLLRASSSMPADSATLLRPAQAGEVPPGQLLHEVTQEADERA